MPQAAPRTNTLRELTNDFHLFTTALINTRTPFEQDPVQEFLRQHRLPKKELPAALDFSYPIFEGIGYGGLLGQPVNWDHRLYVIPEQHWDHCCGFIGSMAILDKEKQYYSRFAWNDILIVDKAAMKRDRGVLESLPTVRVTCFAVASNREFAYIVPAKDPPRTRPWVKVCDPRPVEVREAKAALNPDTRHA